MELSKFTFSKNATTGNYHGNIHISETFLKQTTKNYSTKLSTNSQSILFLCLTTVKLYLPRGVTSSQEASSPGPYTKQFCRLIKINLINGYLALVHQKSTHTTIIYLLKGSVGFWPKSFRSLSCLELGFTFPVWSRSVLLSPLI